MKNDETFTVTLGKIIDSSDETRQGWIDELTSMIEKPSLEVSRPQIDSWIDCLQFLKDNLPKDIDRDTPALFEYTLPRDQKRPDVILLLEGKVLVLEFKKTKSMEDKYGTQVINYCNHLRCYHDKTVSCGYEVEGVIVWTHEKAKSSEPVLGIQVTTKNDFQKKLLEMTSKRGPMRDPQGWCSSGFTILPSMLEAASSLLETGELPMIKSVAESDITPCLNTINALISSVERDGGKVAIVVNGVPGSGKTLVALKTVFEQNSDGLKSVYITGNNPLAETLKAELKRAADEIPDAPKGERAKAALKFICPMTEYKGSKVNQDQKECIIVFDEAQRLWIEDRNDNKDELELLISKLDKKFEKGGKAVLLCMYGEGQVIGRGETNDLSLWNSAIQEHDDWNFYFSEDLAKGLAEGLTEEDRVNTNPALQLNTPIRNDCLDTSKWISSLFSREIIEAGVKSALTELRKKGFQIFITRDFELIKSTMPYCKTSDSRMQQYGMIGSSTAAEKVDSYFSEHATTVEGSYLEPRDVAKWLLSEAEDLKWVATEYAIQGLEIEWPIVMFGEDLYMEDGRWVADQRFHSSGMNKDEKNPKRTGKIIGNVYRVLLTRSRTGMILFLPKGVKRLDELYEFFTKIGVDKLREDTFQGEAPVSTSRQPDLSPQDSNESA